MDNKNRIIVGEHEIVLTADEMMAVFDAVMETDLGTDLDDARKRMKPHYEELQLAYEARHGFERAEG